MLKGGICQGQIYGRNMGGHQSAERAADITTIIYILRDITPNIKAETTEFSGFSVLVNSAIWTDVPVGHRMTIQNTTVNKPSCDTEMYFISRD